MDIDLLFMHVSLRRVRRTLHDLYSIYFLPEVILKFTGKVKEHFVTLIVCISEQTLFHWERKINQHGERRAKIGSTLVDSSFFNGLSPRFLLGWNSNALDAHQCITLIISVRPKL